MYYKWWLYISNYKHWLSNGLLKVWTIIDSWQFPTCVDYVISADFKFKLRNRDHIAHEIVKSYCTLKWYNDITLWNSKII